MDKRIIWALLDGSIYLAFPSPAYLAGKMATGLSEDQVLDELATKWEQNRPDLAAATQLTHKEAVDFPDAHWGRDAWSRSGQSVALDMAKARRIHGRRVIAARDREIVRLQRAEDEARASGLPGEASQHANDRAAVASLNLTTIGSQVAGAQNAATLKTIWPAILPQL